MQVRTTVDSKEAKNLNHTLYLEETNLKGNLSVFRLPVNKNHLSQENHVKPKAISATYSCSMLICETHFLVNHEQYVGHNCQYSRFLRNCQTPICHAGNLRHST